MATSLWDKYTLPILVVIILAIAVIAYGVQQWSFGTLSTATPTPTPTGSPTPLAQKPYLQVSEQALIGGKVNIDEAYFDDPGFVVIHQNYQGGPGAVIGYSDLMMGKKQNLKVPVDMTKVDTMVFAMLHYDSNNNGIYDASDEANPVSVDGKIAVKSINILVSPSPTQSTATSSPTTTASPTASPRTSTTPTLTPRSNVPLY